MDIFTKMNLGIFLMGCGVGGIITLLWCAKIKPFGDIWLVKKLGTAHDIIKKLRADVDDYEVRHNTNMESVSKLVATHKFLSDKIRHLEVQNNDLGETIIALSNEKSSLQDQFQKEYIERDKARAEIVRLTNGGRFAVNSKGKVVSSK